MECAIYRLKVPFNAKNHYLLMKIAIYWWNPILWMKVYIHFTDERCCFVEEVWHVYVLFKALFKWYAIMES